MPERGWKSILKKRIFFVFILVKMEKAEVKGVAGMKTWGLGVIVVIVGGLVFLGVRPDIRERLSLRWEGYHRIELPGIAPDLAPDLVGYVANSCRRGNCFCIAALPDLKQSPKVEGVGAGVGGWKRLVEFIEATPGKAVIMQWLDSGKVDSVPNSSPNSPGTARRLAGEVRGFLERLPEPECSKWIVVGHGYGGWVAQWLGLDWASGVHRLVLLSPQGEIGGDQLGSLEPPTIVLWGREDRVQPLVSSYRIRSALPLRTLWRELPGCGHEVQEECFDEVKKAVTDMSRFGAM